MKRSVFLALWLAVAGPTWCGVDIIIESRSEGLNHSDYRELSGEWMDSNTTDVSKSTAPGVSQCGSRKVSRPLSKESIARFTPKLGAAAKLHAYITWGIAGNCKNVKCVVRHAGGETQVPIVQRGRTRSNIPSNAHKWIDLGEFQFEPNKEQGVDLVASPQDFSPAEMEWNSQAFSDAVRFTDTPPSAVVPAVADAPKPTAPVEVYLTVESCKGGQNDGNYQDSGSWIDSHGPTAKSWAPGMSHNSTCGARKLWPEAGRPSAAAFARFSPKLETPAHLYVYVTWPRAANAQPANYVVRHAKGEDSKSFVQDGWGAQVSNGNANSWLLVGDYDFTPGDSQYLELRVNTGDTFSAPKKGASIQLYADAARFVTKPYGAPVSAPVQPTPPVANIAPAPAPAPPPPPSVPLGGAAAWQTDVRTALKVAAASGKRVLVFFYSADSRNSVRYDSEIFTSPAVQQALAGFIPVRLNLEENTAYAYSLGLFRSGTLAILDAQGRPMKIQTRSLQAGEMAAWLQ